MKLKGDAHKYGRDIDTDVIIPARYLTTTDKIELGKHCLEDLDNDFVKNIKKGDILVAEENFGCGSSREHAPLAIMGSGISLVIASSFARIFYRNAINTGLPIIESEEVANGINTGDLVEADLDEGSVINHTTGKYYKISPYPEFLKEIIASGGLVAKTKKKFGEG